MHRPTARVALITTIVLLAGVASSRGQAAKGVKITINGVDVTGLVDQKFEGCTVAFDSKGNVKITAPGYEIKKVIPEGKSTTPEKKAPLSKHYYLFTESKNGGKVGDKYALIINDKVVKKFKSTDDMIVEDITEHLKSGSNILLITAVKSDSYGGGSQKNWFRIVIGEGHEEENKAVIKKTLHKYTRTADSAQPGNTSYTLKAK